MIETVIKGNSEVGVSLDALDCIHQRDINIAIYERDIEDMSREISNLLNRSIELNLSGDLPTVLDSLKTTLHPGEYHLLCKDIEVLLHVFKEVSGAESFRLLLATVNTNMCRRFHTDLNDLRMLCTYSGPGTLWLSEDNVNREALESCGDNQSIVIDENQIHQAKTGSVVILKGALYPSEGTKAIVHRSPTIEEIGEKRLLLRIDTNDFSFS